MTDEYAGDEEQRYPQPYEGGYENYQHPYQGAYGGPHAPVSDGDTLHGGGAGFAPGEGVWQPLAQGGEFDAEATMSTQFTNTFDFQALATGGQPLAAPGHGYVPQPYVPQERPAPHEAYASPPQEGAAWHPAAEHVPPQAEEQAAAEQWSVPFAPEDPAEESGEYSVGAVVVPPLDPPAPQAAHYPDAYASYASEPYQLADQTQEFAAPPIPPEAYAEDAYAEAPAPEGYAEGAYAEAPAPEAYAEGAYEAPAPEAYPHDTVARDFADDPLNAPLPDSTPPPGAPHFGAEEPVADYPAPDAPPEPAVLAEPPAEPVAVEPLAELLADPGPFAPPEPAEAPEDVPGEPADAAEEPEDDSGADAGADPHSEHPTASYTLTVNGTEKPVTGAWLGESLLYVLRERLGLAGAKDGCEQGECGACSVQVDGRLVASCLVPAATSAGCEVRTVEGLARDGHPSDVQRALAECGAVQCGFCVPGMAMTVHDLLEGNHRPTELQTRAALAGNLCRCSGYQGVLAAVDRVAADREAAHEAEREAERAAGHEHGHDPYAVGHDLFGGEATARIPHQSTGEPDGASS